MNSDKYRTTMNNILKTYKHRYKNIQIVTIHNEETDITIKSNNSDYEFVITIKDSDKLVVFRDNKNLLYHITATDDILNANTEIFVDHDIKNPRILVIENTTNEYMIIKKDSVSYGTVSIAKDLSGEISNYFSDDKKFEILKTGVVFK
jgi:hypothetical protein